METIKLIMLIFIIFLASVNLLLSSFAIIRLRQPTTLMFWVIKVFVSGISPILFLAGIVLAISGLLLNSVPAIVIGSISALLYLFHLIQLTSAPDSFTGFHNQFGFIPLRLHILPQTDHAFDLILPKISPSAHNAIYDVERFLALQVNDENKQIPQKTKQDSVIEKVGME